MDISIFSDHGAFLFRYFHIIGGVAWIGVLWYINFIQGPYVNSIDAAMQTAAKQKLFPKVMWYFRYGALLTFLTGLGLIGLKGFVGAILGGMASYPLAALGAVGVGLLESFSSFWASTLKESIVFTIIIPVLVWRSLTTHHVEEEE